MNCTNSLLIFLLVFAVPVNAQERVEVFTEQATHIDELTGITVIHYDLSEPTRIKKLLAPKLPPDQKLALIQAKTFFVSEEGKAYQSAMREAYRGKQVMMQYQLTKLPAIVFDGGRYVIYGTTDIAQALQLYREHSEQIDGGIQE